VVSDLYGKFRIGVTGFFAVTATDRSRRP
jgi:hypothetical protein